MDRQIVNALGLVALGLILGLPFAIVAVVMIRKLLLLHRKGVEGSGSVVKTGSTEWAKYSVIEFTDPDGVIRRFKTRGALSGTVNIVYDPDHPGRAEAVKNLDPDKLTVQVLRLGCGAVFFGAVVLVSLISAVIVALR